MRAVEAPRQVVDSQIGTSYTVLDGMGFPETDAPSLMWLFPPSHADRNTAQESHVVRRVRSRVCCVTLLATSGAAHAQERDAARLHALVHGLTVTQRVLIIGARPSDADLIAWLARGHPSRRGCSRSYVARARLTTMGSRPARRSATFTSRSCCSRRIDGGEQCFTCAYDVGSARNAAEVTEVTERWERNALLGDVVAIARAFRRSTPISRRCTCSAMRTSACWRWTSRSRAA